MKHILSKLRNIFFGICVGAFFINIGLYVFASSAIISHSDSFELQVLSIFNMIMLSFVLLKDTNKNSI
jgi:hypothetical protein